MKNKTLATAAMAACVVTLFSSVNHGVGSTDRLTG